MERFIRYCRALLQAAVLVLFVMPMAQLAIAAPLSWTTKASMPTPRSRVASGVVNGKIFVLGGDGGSTSVEMYDPVKDSWQSWFPLSQPVFAPCQVSRGDTVYMVSMNSNEVVAYNTFIHTYGPPPPADPNPVGSTSVVGYLNTVRSGRAQAALLNNKMYIIGTGDTMDYIEEFDLNTYTSVTKQTRLPAPRELSMVAAAGGKLYIMGGISAGNPTSTCWEYDPVADRLTDKGPLPIAMAGNMVSAWGGRIYIAGASTSGTFPPASGDATVREYDPANDSWSALDPIPTLRYAAATQVINGTLYVIGGANGQPADYNSAANEAALLPTGSSNWRVQEPMPQGVLHAATTTVNGKIFVLGGRTLMNFGGSSEVYAYDPLGPPPAWQILPSLSLPVLGAPAAAYSQKIYLAGGENSGAASTDIIQYYDTSTTPFSSGTAAYLRYARSRAGAAVLNGKLYVIGGGTPTIEEFDLTTIPISRTDRVDYLPAALSQPSVVEANGKIYIMGGTINNGTPYNVTDTCLVYDPGSQSNRFTPCSPMPVAVEENEGAVYANGRIYLVSGGTNGLYSPGVTAAIQEYDPAADSWEVVDTMGVPRRDHSIATVNGKIYVMGGWPGGSGSSPTTITEEWRVPVNVGTDLTPPQVVFTNPAPSADGIDVHTVIVVGFNKPIDPLTVGSTTFYVNGPEGMLPGSWTANGATATFTPAAPLAYNTAYLVTIAGLKDLSGNQLPAAYYWNFSTIRQFTVSATAIGNGTIICDSPVTAGGTSTCTVTPAEGYVLQDFTDNGIKALSSVAGSTYVMNSLTSDHSLVATFAPVPPTAYTLNITFTGTGGGTVTVEPAPPGMACNGTCSQTFDDGTAVMLTPAAESWATFTGWSGCDSMTENRCNVTMTGAKNVTVHFALGNGLVKPTVAAGMWNSLALKNDGTVWAWGSFSAGPRPFPEQVSWLSEVIGISAGTNHSVALKGDGTVRAWGGNDRGQMGSIVGPGGEVYGLSGIKAVAAGHWYTVALKGDGTVWAWGDNSDGGLGDGTTNLHGDLVQVAGITDVTAIAASHTTLAVKGDGTVWAWGRNDFGQLGDGTTIQRSTPGQVMGLGNIVAVAAGASHSVALKSDGTVWAWGNGYGPIPAQLSGLSGIIGIAAGSSQNIAVKNDGTVWIWAGTGAPVQVEGLSGVVAVAAATHFVVMKNDGTVWAWGDNYNGQLGDGTTTSSSVPVQALINTIAYPLTIDLAGNGTGRVDLPTGGSCPGTCSQWLANGATITLTSYPAEGHIFTGWSGCDSIAGNQCTVSMSGARYVTATFVPNVQYTLNAGKAGSGTGTVTSTPAGIDLTGSLNGTAQFLAGTTVTLTAAPGSGATFSGWRGACIGTGTCTITMNADTSVNAVFTSTAGGNPGPVKMNNQYFPLFQDAYNALSNDSTATIYANATDILEDLVFNRNIAITLKGGYDNSFGTSNGQTVIRGTLTITSGVVILENIIIQ